VATTGVAGPEPQGGKRPGTVWIGVAGRGGSTAHLLALAGERSEVTRATVSTALSLLVSALEHAG
jgi:nicotinamide-nucleotide amidase